MLKHISIPQCSSDFDQSILDHASEVFLGFIWHSQHPSYETNLIVLVKLCRQRKVRLNAKLSPFCVKIQYEAKLRVQLLLIIILLEVKILVLILAMCIGQWVKYKPRLAN